MARSVLVGVLLAARFLLELCLLAAYVVALVRLVPGVLGWVLAAVAATVVATLWGLLLSPRRPVLAPLGVRLAVELALFAAAGLLLVVAGLASAGVALLVAEVVVIGLLGGPDRHAPEVPGGV